MPKILRISTVPSSLNILLKGQLKFLNRYFEITAVSGSGIDLKEVQKREDVNIHVIEMQRQISPFKDLVSLIKLYTYFRKVKPELIHSITPKAGLLSMLAGKLAGVPVRIHTFTGLVFPYKTGIMQKLLIIMDRILCYCATDIFPEGKGVMNDLIKFNITDKPLKIIANGNVNGIDLDFFDPDVISYSEKQTLKTALSIKEDDFVFLFVGRLVRDKGINELVRAFNQLNSEVDNIKLLLVGPFEEELDPILTETKRSIEENSNIISVGFQKDVRPYFAISDIFVFPSYREGFPNVVLQSLAMNVPAIVTDISGSNEIINKHINGMIVDVKNELQLLEAMCEIYKNPAFLEKLIKNSRISVQKFGNKLVWEEIKELYMKKLNNY
ncbi:glycosyltransferase family 4 protein [Epilithonimonas pallida]|uniref:Glycosyltransferase involved in cell wall bisynthesis n=1 Tax=Epilithonimonas pallida TaxID=373671 RepID=A0ABY1R5Q6_9FLAO|nr:glycosyltransferase family 4 protein [Epilithonimonas pallida]SMP96138.1 Glycosyltransferase involved in cell wall bisynthesis [Epilithonimonas pallida]